jgi:hypothetical protein
MNNDIPLILLVGSISFTNQGLNLNKRLTSNVVVFSSISKGNL